MRRLKNGRHDAGGNCALADSSPAQIGPKTRCSTSRPDVLLVEAAAAAVRKEIDKNTEEREERKPQQEDRCVTYIESSIRKIC